MRLFRTCTRVIHASTCEEALARLQVLTDQGTSQQAKVVRSWSISWWEQTPASEPSYADRRERLRRLGIEATVDSKGSERPRYDVAMSIPRPAGDLWFGTEPHHISDEEEANAERQTVR